MYQPERFQIDITEPVPSYSYSGPYTPTVSYYYPQQVVVSGDYRNDILMSDTAAIRRDLSDIKYDIADIRRQQGHPTYYSAKQDYSNSSCPMCTSSSSGNQQYQYPQNPVASYEEYPSFVEERPYTAGGAMRSSAPITTYQDHYREPSRYGSARPSKRRTTLNELQTQSPSSSHVQHPRNWVPSAHKNSYPNRRWNLSVPHPEP